MEFSELAKALFPYCSNGMKQAEFVILLVDKIMAGRPGRAYKDGTYRNPLRIKQERTLLSYFNGDRYISRRDATQILGSIDKYKFETYLRTICSDEALKLLKNDVSCKVNLMETEDVVEVCADQFELIIKDLASKELN